MSAFPGGFLLGLSERDCDHANKLLDAAVANPEWHAFLPHMQSCIGLEKAGSERLIAVISSPTLPAWTLRNLAGGRLTDDLGDAEFRALLEAIAAKDDGLGPSIEILFMRLFSLRTDKKPISDVERDIARALLSKFPFYENKSREPHMLADIVRFCLLDPEDADLARDICLRLLDAIGEWKASPWDYSELVTELAAIFPRIVLEAALEREGADAEARRGLFGNFRDNRPCPLRKIADDELLCWAQEKPETRFPALAAVIHAGKGPKAEKDPDIAPDDETGELKWTPIALRLIHEAPDPVAVLNAFSEHFRPSGWSGSLADILSRRAALLEVLVDDPDQRIQGWARAAVPMLREEIERTRKWEADHDRERDERFDW